MSVRLSHTWVITARLTHSYMYAGYRLEGLTRIYILRVWGSLTLELSLSSGRLTCEYITTVGHIYKQIWSTWQSVKASTLESAIRGCHIYKQIRRPLVREILTLEREEDNNHDKFSVSLLKNATILGHGPREFLQVFWHFLRHGETITCEVTDQRKRGKATSQC